MIRGGDGMGGGAGGGGGGEGDGFYAIVLLLVEESLAE